MPNITAIIAIVAGAGGMLLSHAGKMVPARKDFVSAVKLKKDACLENIAASHCFLLKQFLSVGLEDFDNVMRGDGRTSRDFFAEHARVSIDAALKYKRLSRYQVQFRIAHFLLLLSTVGLILSGVVMAVFESRVPYALEISGALFLVELGSVFTLYMLGDANEG